MNDMLMMLKDVAKVMSIDLLSTGRAREKFRKHFGHMGLIISRKNTFHKKKRRLQRGNDNWGRGASLARNFSVPG